MLKITPITEGSKTTLVLEGKLVGPWIDELERTWVELRKTNPAHTLVLDLRDVTSVSYQGQQVLREMKLAGVFVNCSRGVHTMHVLRNLILGPGCIGHKKEKNR